MLWSNYTAPVCPFQPPRRARSDVGDSRAVNSTHDGGIVSPSGGERRQGHDEPALENGDADSPTAAAEGNKLLSEDSFYRVAVEKIMERERLGAATSERHGDCGSASGSGGGKSGGIRGGRRRRPHGEDTNGLADPMLFASPRGALPGRLGKRKVISLSCLTALRQKLA